MKRSSTRHRIRDKRDRFRQLRAFCETVRHESISRAAEGLGLTQPAVSIHLRELEYELEAVLLDRDSRGASPTPAGDRLYALAAPLVQGVDDLFNDFQRSLDQVSEGKVRLAVTTTGAAYILPPYIKRFREQYPHLRIRLDTVSQPEGLQLLDDDEVDLVMGNRAAKLKETLDYHEVNAYRPVLITPLDHPLAERESVSVEEASAWPAVVPPADTRARLFGENTARQFGVEVNAVMEVGGWGVLKRYVEAGFGISVVPSLCLSEPDRLSVVRLDADFPPLSYGMFVRRDRHLTSSAQRFLQFLLPGGRDSTPPPPPRRPASARAPSRRRQAPMTPEEGDPHESD